MVLGHMVQKIRDGLARTGGIEVGLLGVTLRLQQAVKHDLCRLEVPVEKEGKSGQLMSLDDAAPSSERVARKWKLYAVVAV